MGDVIPLSHVQEKLAIESPEVIAGADGPEDDGDDGPGEGSEGGDDQDGGKTKTNRRMLLQSPRILEASYGWRSVCDATGGGELQKGMGCTQTQSVGTSFSKSQSFSETTKKELNVAVEASGKIFKLFKVGAKMSTSLKNSVTKKMSTASSIERKNSCSVGSCSGVLWQWEALFYDGGNQVADTLDCTFYCSPSHQTPRCPPGACYNADCSECCYETDAKQVITYCDPNALTPEEEKQRSELQDFWGGVMDDDKMEDRAALDKSNFVLLSADSATASTSSNGAPASSPIVGTSTADTSLPTVSGESDEIGIGKSVAGKMT